VTTSVRSAGDPVIISPTVLRRKLSRGADDPFVWVMSAQGPAPTSKLTWSSPWVTSCVKASREPGVTRMPSKSKIVGVVTPTSRDTRRATVPRMGPL
jgi:hypothetical protein